MFPFFYRKRIRMAALVPSGQNRIIRRKNRLKNKRIDAGFAVKALAADRLPGNAAH